MYYSSVVLLAPLLLCTNTLAQYAAITSTDELYFAVSDYMANSTSNMTYSALMFGYPIGTWDVSAITNFTRVFDPDRSAPFDGTGCGSIQSTFNENITGWDISNAVTTVGMFACTQFNQDISSWYTGNVKNMSGMFMFASGTFL